MIDIIPIHRTHYSCLEDIIATIADWKKRDCIFMFAGAWSFKFFTGQNNICHSLHIGNEDYAYYLNKHHGIALNWHKEFKANDIDTLIYEIKNDRPVLIHLNSFYCSWHMYYGKKHAMHFCLLIGMFENGFKCIDPYLTTNIINLSMEDFNSGCREYAFVECNDRVEPFADSYHSILHSIHKAMDNRSDIFKQMEAFSAEILNNNNLLNEINNTQDLLESTIIEKVKFIGLGRRNYAKLICEMGEHFNIEDLLHISQPIDKLTNDWEKVKWLLVKCKIVKEQQKIINDISNVIHDIAFNENEVMNQLLDIMLKNKESMSMYE